MEMTLGTYKAEWVDIGEGLDGMYDPDNPDDIALLRIDTYELVNGEWETIDDGSYCTGMPVASSPETLEAGLRLILEELNDLGGASPKKMMEGMSWMAPEWFA